MLDVCATSAMTNTKPKPSKQFMEDFKLCMEYYNVEIDEAKFERGRCLDNMDNAFRCCRYRDWETDRKSTRLNSSHRSLSRMPSSA